MALCKCPECKSTRKLERILSTIPEKQAKQIHTHIHKLLEAKWTSEMDASYYKSIVDGDWPSSVSILTRSLQIAIKKHGGTK